MTIHHFTPTQYYNTLGVREPVLCIQPGDTIITTTVDAMGQDANGAKIAVGPNPQTGPFFIEGAEPGDTLVVHLDKLTPNREAGWSSQMLAPHVVDAFYVPRLPWDRSDNDAEWRVNAVAGTACLVRPEGKLGSFTLPIHPMVGCLGVAPNSNQEVSAMTSGQHGGNMDYRGLVAGVTVYFPVFVPGALFSLGDGHARQSDGEVSGSGIEISFDVQFTVDLRKGRRSYWPRGENEHYIFTLGNARPLDQAVQHATTEMVCWLQEEYGLSPRETNMLVGHCAEYDLANMFDPAYTMVCKIPKQLIP
ncbi:MAG TPA: acetamidase/formamidase family protein [Phototrophicaceae bacterium]|nr:acetamidase/formamidase family protein [Phototrophicaceae bacterium]